MTAHETRIAKRILNYLHELDGGQAHALTIHAEIGGLNVCTNSDFTDTLAELDRRKHVIGVQTQFKGVLWSLSDDGESARKKM
jgi:hypothetical protein